MAQQPAPAAISLPIEGELPVAGRRDRLAQFAAADAGRPARQSRAGRLLDLHLHQLAPHASLYPGLGREVPGSGIGRDRRAHARVRFRARPRQRAPSREGDEGRLSGRARQRLRDLAGLQQPLLARALFRRRARGTFAIIISARANTRSRSGSSSSCWPRPAARASVTTWYRSMPAGAKPPPIGAACRSPENYVGYERTENFASPGGAVPDRAHTSTPLPNGCGSINGRSRATGRWASRRLP